MISEISKNPIKYRNEPEWYKDWIALRNEVLNMETVEHGYKDLYSAEVYNKSGKGA